MVKNILLSLTSDSRKGGVETNVVTAGFTNVRVDRIKAVYFDSKPLPVLVTLSETTV